MALYNKFFYNEVIRKYVILFGHLFSDIEVIRRNRAGQEIRREQVPLTYAPKEKFVARLEQDYAEDRKVAIKLPHMAFEITGYSYAPERKLSSFRKIKGFPTDDQLNYTFNPVPYDLDFDLHIFTKTQEEGLQIIEQIIPFFTPQYTLTANLLKDIPDCKFDIPVSLLSVTSQDTYEGSFEERRSVEWTLSFKLAGWVFGPTRNQGLILNSKIQLILSEYPIEKQPKIEQRNIDLPGVVTIETIEGLTGELLDTFEDVVDPTPDNLFDEVGTDAYVIFRGTDFAFLVDVSDESGNSVDLRGGTATAKYRKSISDPNPVIIPAEIIDPDTIRVDVPGLSTQDSDIGIYIFDVFYNAVDGSTIKLVEGKFFLR